MNWLGKLVQKQISKKDTVLDLCCGIMQATLDVVPAYPRTRLKCRYIVGIDFYKPYLERIKGKENIVVIYWDLKRGLPIILSKSFDVVLLLDALEHFQFKEAQFLMDEAERVARRKVIIYTPRVFYDNQDHKVEHFPYCGLGDNPYQEHLSLISAKYLREKGYAVSFPNPDYNVFAVKVFE